MLQKISNFFTSIREFLWPILDPLEPTKLKKISLLDDCKFLESEIDFELKYLEEYKKSEDERKKNVENKATIFIGTFAVAITILINLVKELIINPDANITLWNVPIIVLIAITVIYLCRAVLFSIKTLERRNYATLGFPDFLFLNDIDKKRKILVKQYNAIKENQKEINIKVDYMTMAQAFFKRAVFAVLVLTIIFLLYFLNNYFIDQLSDLLQFICQIFFDFLEHVQNLIKSLKCTKE